MYFIIGLIVVSICIGALCWLIDKEWWHAGLGFGISFAIFLVVVLLTWGTSYNSYLNLKNFSTATHEQYVGAVEIYGNWAVISILQEGVVSDFKYQGYQENMSDYISSLKNKVIWYNNELVSKRMMKKNPIFSWLIVAPDEDMVPIKIRDGFFLDGDGATAMLEEGDKTMPWSHMDKVSALERKKAKEKADEKEKESAKE